MRSFTQRKSLQELIASGARARSHKSVMRALFNAGAQTDLELSNLSGVSRSGVCGRIAELIKIGYIEESNPVRCAKTGKLVRTTRLTVAGIFAAQSFMQREVMVA